jgi:hypothetical protein
MSEPRSEPAKNADSLPRCGHLTFGVDRQVHRQFSAVHPALFVLFHLFKALLLFLIGALNDVTGHVQKRMGSKVGNATRAEALDQTAVREHYSSDSSFDQCTVLLTDPMVA